jgi:hypothetical protein
MDDGSDPVARNLQGFDPVKHAFPNSTATFSSARAGEFAT